MVGAVEFELKKSQNFPCPPILTNLSPAREIGEGRVAIDGHTENTHRNVAKSAKFFYIFFAHFAI